MWIQVFKVGRRNLSHLSFRQSAIQRFYGERQPPPQWDFHNAMLGVKEQVIAQIRQELQRSPDAWFEEKVRVQNAHAQGESRRINIKRAFQFREALF
jgi:hypothetical protein